MQVQRFKTSFAETIFNTKYRQGPNDNWDALCDRLVEDVCGTRWGTQPALMSKSDMVDLAEHMKQMRFLAGGRYLYYAGRPHKYYNNCFLLKAEYDTREEWANLLWRASSCLMVGGGIGVDYSLLRPAGRPLSKTGGIASGPLPLMQMMNEVGRGIMQGGSRRSAIYASLNWQHEDIPDFLRAKNWSDDIRRLKEADFNFPGPLDMTNISVNYDDAAFLPERIHGLGGESWDEYKGLERNPIFLENCRQAMMTGEPGFSFNFGDKQNETLRNACTEVTSEDDSDVCNLGSINLGNIKSLEEFKSVVNLASKFLVCGTLRADLPYEKVYKVREKNRRLGLGLMGIHEWLLQRNQKYEVTEELHDWLACYRDESKRAADEHCDRFFISRPVAYRAVAPTGTIGILALIIRRK
jgi:ribonucleoside-diphosphate reductase alpha chain